MNALKTIHSLGVCGAVVETFNPYCRTYMNIRFIVLDFPCTCKDMRSKKAAVAAFALEIKLVKEDVFIGHVVGLEHIDAGVNHAR